MIDYNFSYHSYSRKNVHTLGDEGGNIKLALEVINLNDEKTGLIGKPKGTGAKVRVKQPFR